ncbi:MAG: Ger(x)C family spore germination protein [Syntrophomonas sp.]|nr:Ger(x)C family spore germination protein [Syntrophomonas sp.]
MQLDKNHLIQMNKWKLVCILFLILFSLFFTTGCWNQLEVNDTAEAAALVVDLEENQPSLSVQLVHRSSAGESGSSSPQHINITQVASTFTEAARRITLSVPRLPTWSHAGSIIIGDNLASQDLGRATDFLARNRNIRKSALVFISKDATGKECLDAEVYLESHAGNALKKLISIQETQLGIYTPVTLDQFLQNLATPGIDPTVPQLSIQKDGDKNMLRLDGTAVFKERKKVGSLNEMESQGYRFINPKMITGGLIIIFSPLENIPDSDKLISIELTRSQAKITPQIEGNRIINMKISIEAEGNFYEQTFAEEFISFDNINALNEMVNEKIKALIIASIVKAQLLNSDIFGWGQSVYRTNPSLWNEIEKDWPEIFPSIQADITVNFQLRRSYLLDESFKFR